MSEFETNEIPEGDLPEEASSTTDIGPIDEIEPEAGPARPAPLGALTFGALVAVALAGATGVGLSFHYVPTPEGAHPSVLAIQSELPYGPALRSVHLLASHASIALGICVLLGALFRADHRLGAFDGLRPHIGKWTWWTGLAALLTTTGIAITGELLPWSRQAVLATEVRTGLLADVPVVGSGMERAVLGQPEVGAATLTRFHSLHTQILPLVLLGLAIWHWRCRVRLSDRPLPNLWQGLTGLLVAAGIAWGARRFDAPLEAWYAPGEGNFEAWPEWNFLWLNALIQAVPSNLGFVAGTVVPGVLTAALFAWPLLDRARSHRFSKPWFAIPGLIVLAAVVGISVVRAGDKEPQTEVMPYELDWDDELRRGYLVARSQHCLECHAFVVEDANGNELRRFGGFHKDYDEDWPNLNTGDFSQLDELSEFEYTLSFPEDPMPVYEDLLEPGARRDLIALFRFLKELNKD